MNAVQEARKDDVPVLPSSGTWSASMLVCLFVCLLDEISVCADTARGWLCIWMPCTDP